MQENTVSIGGSYRRYWKNVCEIISSLENNGYKVIAPNKDWEPMLDEYNNVKFRGEQNIPISTLEVGFIENMLSSENFIICDSNGYVGPTAYYELLLAYYSITNSNYINIRKKVYRTILKNHLNIAKTFGLKSYEYFDDLHNSINAIEWKESLLSKGKEEKIRHIYLTEMPIGMDYWDENGNIKENFKSDFFKSKEYENERNIFLEGRFYDIDFFMQISGEKDNDFLFTYYLNILYKFIRLVKLGMKKGIISIGIDDLLLKENNELQMKLIKNK